MKKILIILGTFVLIGCAAGPQPRWHKAGVSAEEAQNQHAECVYNVGINKVDTIKEHELIKACMVSKGFRWGVPRSY